jgi:hypothetical protein
LRPGLWQHVLKLVDTIVDGIAVAAFNGVVSFLLVLRGFEGTCTLDNGLAKGFWRWGWHQEWGCKGLVHNSCW